VSFIVEAKDGVARNDVLGHLVFEEGGGEAVDSGLSFVFSCELQLDGCEK